MSECIKYHEFCFYWVNNTFMVGDNTTTVRNGLINQSNCPDVVVIPLSVEGHKVEQIGQYSFYSCPQIKVLIIEARITCINLQAFRRNFNLQRIYLPNTLKEIYGWGIQMYDPNSIEEVPSHGSVDIIFEPNSQLSHLSDHSISYKENVNVYICDHVQPSSTGNPFARVINLRLFSPISFNILGRNTIISNYTSLCSVFNSLTFHCDHIINMYVHFFISHCFIQIVTVSY